MLKVHLYWVPMPVVVIEDDIKGLFGGGHDTLGEVSLVKEKLYC